MGGDQTAFITRHHVSCDHRKYAAWDGPMNMPEPAHEIDPAHFRRVMGRFATGVTVITARADGEVRGMTANAFMSGSLEPPLCIVSVTKRAHMHGHLIEAGAFAVNILADRPGGPTRTHFAGRPIPGLDVPFVDLKGVPTLADASACIVADARLHGGLRRPHASSSAISAR